MKTSILSTAAILVLATLGACSAPKSSDYMMTGFINDTKQSNLIASSYKPAELENGVRTLVPPFIATGDKIVVKTEDGSYVERAKS